MILKETLNDLRQQVDTGLTCLMLKPEGLLGDHIDSMRYSLFAGGKRVRPILCMTAAQALGVQNDAVLTVACALECIHTYSLIHDDLPAMDNDELRRGKPTNHKIYGEAQAILAGDGLLTFAFDLLSSEAITSYLDSRDQLRLINIIARAAGSCGMVGGQAVDIASEGKEISFTTLRFIHSYKTGALITASVQAGAILGHASTVQFDQLTQYGENIGLAFQIIDDILNVEGTTEQLGKAAGSDADRGKATYPSFFGLETSRAKALEAVNNAVQALHSFDERAGFLRELAQYLLTRKK